MTSTSSALLDGIASNWPTEESFLGKVQPERKPRGFAINRRRGHASLFSPRYLRKYCTDENILIGRKCLNLIFKPREMFGPEWVPAIGREVKEETQMQAQAA